MNRKWGNLPAVWSLSIALLVLGVAADAGAQVDAVHPQGPRPTPGWPVVLGNGIHSSPVAADLDGDGRDELAVGTRDGRIFLLDGQGRILPGWPQTLPGKIYFSPVFTDLDGDGLQEVLVGGFDQRLHAFRISGARVEGWPLDLGSPPATAPQRFRAGPEARPGVLIGCVDGRVWLFDDSGVVLPGWPQQGGPRTTGVNFEANPLVIADLDGDGSPEILWLSRHDAVLQAWRIDGRVQPGYPLRLGGTGLGLTAHKGPTGLEIACTLVETIRLIDAAGRPILTLTPTEDMDRFASTVAFLPAGFVGVDDEATSPYLLSAGTAEGWVEIWDARGRSAPGWPRLLHGFIYGRVGRQNRYEIRAAPVVHDVDGDGRLEAVVGSYDQHLYAFRGDGELVPGWPLTVGDALVSKPVFAQIDGRGGQDMVVGQYGETLAAFRLDEPAITASQPAGRSFTLPVSGRGKQFALAGLSALLALLILRLLRSHGLALSMLRGRRDSRWILTVVAVLILARGLVWMVELIDYRRFQAPLVASAPLVAEVLGTEQQDASRQIGTMAALLDSVRATDLHRQSDWLGPLEHVADLLRLDYDLAGLLVTDVRGQVLAATGLARAWGGLVEIDRQRPSGEAASHGLVMLGGNPVLLIGTSLGPPDDGRRLIFARSLLDRFPQNLADGVAASVEVRWEGRTLAWAGLPSGPITTLVPWLGRVEPAHVLPLGTPGLEVRLSRPDYDRKWIAWLDLFLVLLLPVLMVVGLLRNVTWPSPDGNRIWLLFFGLIYLCGYALVSGGSLAQRPVPLSAGTLEVLLHGLGMLGALLALRLFIGTRLTRRLSFTLLLSYLLVGLVPLSLVLMLSANLLTRAQRVAVGSTLASIEQRADNILMAYLGDQRFPASIERAGQSLLDPSLHRGWFDFVSLDQYFFTYDLPSAYVTLRAQERDDPTRFFTGFSYRAPRTEKFFATLPTWAGNVDLGGLFLEQGTPLIRSVRHLRLPDLNVQLAAHVPLDRVVLGRLQEELRILPVLPRMRVTPTWVGADPVDPADGLSLPLRHRIAVSGRDWRTGTPRWMVLEVQAYVPAGREMVQVLGTLILLALVPLGLSLLGALFTLRRTVRPLSDLMAGIQRVQQGDLEFRLGPAGQSEIAQAGQAFDLMADSLQQTIQEAAEKKKVEEVSALKSRFISMVSHDLKTPLASIQGAAENILAEMAGPLTENQRIYLEMILESSGNLQKKIIDILDLSRIDSGHLVLEPEILDVRLEVDNVLRSLEPLLVERGLRAGIEVKTDETEVLADRTRLWQIVNNLVGNAMDHSPPDGAITVAIAHRDPGLLAVTVADQGPGIAPEDRDQIFEPFHTRSSGGRTGHGAGLGLAIVRQLVTLHGGTVQSDEVAGGGASLTFTLPRRDPDSE